MKETGLIHTIFRDFFDSQVDHLQSLVTNLSIHPLGGVPQTEEDRRILEDFVAASNNKMRAVSNYQKKLSQYVQTLHSYVLQIVDEIPPPIELNLNAFGTDELVNALFAGSNDIDKLLNNNPELNVFLRTQNVPIIFALLTADRHEKRTLGVAMQGDMLIRDVPQQTVNFSSHKLHKPCVSLAELNTVLKEYLFSRVISLLKQEMSDLMSDQPLNADMSYEARLKSLANPDVYLETLIKKIENPAELLRINKIHFRLSKLGIKLEGNDQQTANEFDIHEIIWRDSIRRVVLQVKLPANSCNGML